VQRVPHRIADEARADPAIRQRQRFDDAEQPHHARLMRDEIDDVPFRFHAAPTSHRATAVEKLRSHNERQRADFCRHTRTALRPFPARPTCFSAQKRSIFMRPFRRLPIDNDEVARGARWRQNVAMGRWRSGYAEAVHGFRFWFNSRSALQFQTVRVTERGELNRDRAQRRHPQGRSGLAA
jgi:hypothetical protein